MLDACYLAKCKQSSILTSIQNNKFTASRLIAKKATEKIGKVIAWWVSVLETIKEHQK
jgi:hypothetical protein